jgi:hypothetical protein
MTGKGLYKDVTEAFSAIDSTYEVFDPGSNRSRYGEFYHEFALKVFERGGASKA